MDLFIIKIKELKGSVMKKMFLLFLVFTLVISGCSLNPTNNMHIEDKIQSDESNNLAFLQEKGDRLDNPDLLPYIENSVYQDLVQRFDSDRFFVENVQAKYISKEYLDELSFNSQSNSYFGFNLKDLDKEFQDVKYIFTTDDNGKTTVKEFKKFDSQFDTVIKNVAIGTGVILVCVTVTVLTSGAGAPTAVNVIFAASAKGAVTFGTSGSVFGGVSKAIASASKGESLDKILSDVAVGASEGFKWGAITGAVTGGTGKFFDLNRGAKAGLSLNEVAKIQKESKWPTDVIKSIKNMDQYNLYKQSNLKHVVIKNRNYLIKDIDLDYKVLQNDGKYLTNRELMRIGSSPVDKITNEKIELHHLNQEIDGTLATLSFSEHRASSVNAILHDSSIEKGVHSKIGSMWTPAKVQHWKDLLEYYEKVNRN